MTPAAAPGPPPPSPSPSLPPSLRTSSRRIADLAWPVFVGQISGLAFPTIDTLVLARHASIDLAALAVGGAIYGTVFIAMMGTVLSLSPIVGRLHGAGDFAEAGRQTHQMVWIALALAALGALLLCVPAPFLRLAAAGPELAPRVESYLVVMALVLPGSLLFTIYRAFNTAVSRPKAVMKIQLGGLALKLAIAPPLMTGLPALGLPALGVQGAALSTGIVMWLQVGAAALLLRREAFYAPYALVGRGLDAPSRAAIRAQLKLGLPMGGTLLVEGTGFAFMALLIARIGAVDAAAHQIAINLLNLTFMVPLALASATMTLVSQAIGAQRIDEARRIGWHGIAIGSAAAAAVALALGLLRGPIVAAYTPDPTVAAAALTLVALAALAHLGDAVQTMIAFVLRAWHVATATLIVYVLAIWGVGLGGGSWLAFGGAPWVPEALRGAAGIWAAAALGVALASAGLAAALTLLLRSQPAARRDDGAAAPRD